MTDWQEECHKLATLFLGEGTDAELRIDLGEQIQYTLETWMLDHQASIKAKPNS